MPEMFHA
jgi:hypothetical protein